MDEKSQWAIAALIGTSITALLPWFNKSDSDFKDGFSPKTKGQKRKNKFHPMRIKKKVVPIPIRTQ